MKWDEFDVENSGDQFLLVSQSNPGNIGIFVKNGKALVVDSGYSPRKMARLKELIENNLACRIDLLFNTHYHSDHTFGNQVFNCPILASEECYLAMKNALTSHWSPEEIRKAMAEDPTLKEKWQDLTITLPTETFSGQKSIEFEGTKIDFLRLGGHTPCSSIAVFPDYRFMFAGDLIFAERYPTLLWDGNPIELVSVLKRIDQMEIDTFAPGHGPICGKSSIDNLTDYYECLIENCGKLLADGKSIEEISDLWKELCPIPGVPMDEMRHKRNINSISGFLRGHDAR